MESIAQLEPGMLAGLLFVCILGGLTIFLMARFVVLKLRGPAYPRGVAGSGGALGEAAEEIVEEMADGIEEAGDIVEDLIVAGAAVAAVDALTDQIDHEPEPAQEIEEPAPVPEVEIETKSAPASQPSYDPGPSSDSYDSGGYDSGDCDSGGDW